MARSSPNTTIPATDYLSKSGQIRKLQASIIYQHNRFGIVLCCILSGHHAKLRENTDANIPHTFYLSICHAGQVIVVKRLSPRTDRFYSSAYCRNSFVFLGVSKNLFDSDTPLRKST